LSIFTTSAGRRNPRSVASTPVRGKTGGGGSVVVVAGSVVVGATVVVVAFVVVGATVVEVVLGEVASEELPQAARPASRATAARPRSRGFRFE
jgi:predicted metalloprotease